MTAQQAVVARILELCKERGFSINHLAYSSAVPPSTLKNIVNSTSKNPGVVTLKMLCDGLEITLTDFFNTEVFESLEQELKWFCEKLDKTKIQKIIAFITEKQKAAN